MAGTLQYVQWLVAGVPKLSRHLLSFRWRPALGCVLVSACVFGPASTDDLKFERFEPLPSYTVWWEEAKACTGRAEADIRRLRFFQVLAPLNTARTQFPCPGGEWCPAFWEQPHDIYLAPGVIDSKLIVKHEMLHDLMPSASEDRILACLRTQLPF